MSSFRGCDQQTKRPLHSRWFNRQAMQKQNNFKEMLAIADKTCQLKSRLLFIKSASTIAELGIAVCIQAVKIDNLSAIIVQILQHIIYMQESKQKSSRLKLSSISIYASEADLRKKIHQEAQPRQPNQGIKAMAGFMNARIYDLKYKCQGLQTPEMVRALKNCHCNLLKSKCKDPRKLSQTFNIFNLQMVIKLMKHVVNYVDGILEQTSDSWKQTSFQNFYFAFDLMTVCKQFEELLLPLLSHDFEEVKNKLMKEDWKVLISEVEKAFQKLTSLLKNPKNQKRMLEEAKTKFENSNEAEIALLVFMIKYKILYNDNGEFRFRENGEVISNLLKSWRDFHGRISCIGSVETVQTIVNNVQSCKIMEECLRYIEVSVDKFRANPNEKNKSEIQLCYQILKHWEEAGLKDKNWYFYRAHRMLISQRQKLIRNNEKDVWRKKKIIEQELSNPRYEKLGQKNFKQDVTLKILLIGLSQSRFEIEQVLQVIWEDNEGENCVEKNYQLIENARNTIKQMLCVCLKNMDQINELGQNLPSTEQSYEQILRKTERQLSEGEVDKLWEHRNALRSLWIQNSSNLGVGTIQQIVNFLRNGWLESEESFSKQPQKPIENRFDAKWKSIFLWIFNLHFNTKALIETEKTRIALHCSEIQKTKFNNSLNVLEALRQREQKENEKQEIGYFQFSKTLSFFENKKYSKGWCKLINSIRDDPEIENRAKQNQLALGELKTVSMLIEFYKSHTNWIKKNLEILINLKLPYLLPEHREQLLKNSKLLPEKYFEDFDEILQALHVLMLPEFFKRVNQKMFIQITERSRVRINDQHLSKFVICELIKSKDNEQLKTKKLCYTINLTEPLGYQLRQKCSTILKGLQTLEKSNLLSNYCKIENFHTDSELKKVYVYVSEVEQNSCQKLKKIIKQGIKKYNKFRKSHQDFFPNWHLLLTSKTFTIKRVKHTNDNDGDESLNLVINPLEALLISLLIPPQKVCELYLKSKHPSFSMIHLMNLIQNQAVSDWFETEREEFEFEHLIKEVRAIEMETDMNEKSELFFNCPFFWNEYRRIIQIVSFKESYQKQINYEESRRKMNDRNMVKLHNRLKQLEQELKKLSGKKKQANKERIGFLEDEIEKCRKQIRNFSAVKQKKMDEDIKRKIKNKEKERLQLEAQLKEAKKESEITEKTKKIETLKLEVQKQIQKLTPKKQKENNKKNSNSSSKKQKKQSESSSDSSQEEDFDISQIKYQYAKEFNRATQVFYSIEGVIEKAAFEDNIGNFQQDSSSVDPRFSRYEWLEGKEEVRKILEYVSEKEGKGSKSNNLYQMSFPSFQNHIRWMRNMCVHSTQDISPIVDLSHQKKIEIISRNFPKLFLFIYRWRNIVGKPLVADAQEGKNIDVKSQIKKTLLAAFRLNNSNSRHIERLEQIEELNHYYSDPYQLFKYDVVETEREFQKYCRCCNILSKSTSKCIKKNWYFWEFLNDIKTDEFNVLFFEHSFEEGAKPCQWGTKNQVLIMHNNCMRRQNFTTEQIALLKEDQEKTNHNDLIEKRQLITIARLNSDAEKKKELIEELFETDYIPRIFVHELLLKFPSLIDDLRYTRYLWDERIPQKLR